MNKLALIAILLFCLCPLTAAASDATEQVEMIALEIRNLSTSVDSLAQLLFEQGQQKEQDAVFRKLDIAVAYLNFRSRRIEMLERDKLNKQNMKNRLEDIIQQIEARAEQLEESDQDDPAAREDNETARQETQEQLKMMKQRQSRVDEALFDFDNQIVELRNQLDDVEGFVERHLEL